MIFAQGPTTPAYQVITNGIRSTLAEAHGDGLNLHLEYLEINLYADNEFPCEQFEYINQKYENIDIDLMICVGINIISNVKKCASNKIKDLPIITIDYDLKEYGILFPLKLNDINAVIGIKLNLLGTLKSAINLFPDRHHLYIICGTSNTDQLYLKITKDVIPYLDEQIVPTFVTNISMDDAISTVRNLPDSSWIFIPGFNMDSKKVFYYNPEAIRLISQAANAPVFTISDMGFGGGSMGGYILSFNKTGLLAGDIAVKILNGQDPNMVKVVESDYYDQLYDWRELKRWNLTGSKLIPGDGKIEFEEKNFINEYKWFITAGVLFLFMQSLLILNLIRLNRKQKIATQKLIETENIFHELVNEDRILRLAKLTSSLSHELNQPLTAILSTAQAGKRFIASGKLEPGLMNELFDNIVEDDKRTASILSSIRGMMKLEKREKEQVNLNELILEILEIYKGESIVKGIQINPDLPEEPICVVADRIQIQQVIMNFIINAIQSTGNSMVESKEIRVLLKHDDDTVTLSVKDNGMGIDEKIRDKIFRPFVTSKKEGTGIGLAISKSIIDDHGGKIWAENIPEGGAIFSFQLKRC